MPSDKQSTEPSMEEILASIRRIISEESADTSSPAGDVLDLTEVVEDENPAAAPMAEAPDMGARVPDPPPPPEPAPPEPAFTETERLVSGLTAAAASSRFTALAKAAEPDPLEGMRGGRTVEDLAIDLLRPMLKEWLDTNLPTIVERMVEREIRYLSRRTENE